MSKQEKSNFQKVVLLSFFASFFGHNNLNQILSAYRIEGKELYSIYNSLSNKDFEAISRQLIEYFIRERLLDIGVKGLSTWSRLHPCYVIDASIFKMWLTEADNEFYNKFFSGQTKRTQYGYKINLGGIAIDGTFYPLIFKVTSKKDTDAEVAQTILKEMHQITLGMEKEYNLTFGQWYLSVDSGYSDINLLNYADKELKIIPICVPAKNHIFEINNQKTNLRQYTEEHFIPQEQEYYMENGSDAEPFTIRIRAFYKSKNSWVTLLIFRLKGSKKVSAIYTTNLDIKAKTLRRNWFQRTHIEQFFRFCKHTLEFAASTYKNLDGFLRKIRLFFLKALFCNVVRNEFRKLKGMKSITFGNIRSHVTTYRIGEDWLINLINMQEPF